MHYRDWDFSSTRARRMDLHAQHSSANRLTFNMGNKPLLRMEQSWAASGVQASLQVFFCQTGGVLEGCSQWNVMS